MWTISWRRRRALVVSDWLGRVYEASVGSESDARLPIVETRGATCVDAGCQGKLDPWRELGGVDLRDVDGQIDEEKRVRLLGRS